MSSNFSLPSHSSLPFRPSRPVSFANPRFVTSVGAARDFPSWPAVAFAGRSNAGKSSAINALCNGRFAKVSAAPGRTRTVNFFALGPGSSPKHFLADLPGLGYAVASKRDRAALSRLALSFARDGNICGLVLIVDCRRGIGDADENIIRRFAPRDLPLLIALSKCDKLKRAGLHRAVSDAERRLLELSPELSSANAEVSAFSALKKTALPELRARVSRMLRGV